MPGLDNKISNIIGTAIPTWLLKQLEARSNKNTLDSRDTQNILYLSNKTAWIRLVSSINISDQDIPYFQRKGAIITKPEDLAKNYVLFAGTSKYRPKTDVTSQGYDIRSGLGKDGAYNLFGEKEVNDYGYRPMPGITNVTIETQGTLGSIRGATVNFKVWDKDQLDIMDALYFKLGFSMFLEWGHTYFYHSERESPNINPDNIYSTEEFSIDPFQANLTKEDINLKISEGVRKSEGNYDAMLGLVSNFNFTYNEAGGFDCTLKLMALGYLGDQMKINHPKILPNILELEIRKLNNIKRAIDDANLAALNNQPESKIVTIDSFLISQKQQGKLTNPQLVAVSSPEYFTQVSITENNTFKQVTKILPSNEITPDDRVVNLVDANNDQYIYITRIGQVVKYNRDTYNTGYIDTDRLDTFKSDLTEDFVSNIMMSSHRFGQLGKITYDSPTGEGVKTFFISFSFDGLDLATQKGKNLTKDFIIPAIKEALKGPLQVSVYQDPFVGHVIRFKGTYSVSATTDAKVNSQAIALNDTAESSLVGTRVLTTKKGNFIFSTNDSLFVKDIQLSTPTPNNFLERQLYLDKLKAQDQSQVTIPDPEVTDAEVTNTQVHNAVEYLSSLEVMLRTIQIHSLGVALDTTNDVDIKKAVFKVDLTKEIGFSNKKLVTQLFSDGVFTNFLDQLLNKNIVEGTYPKENKLPVFAKYGFNTALLGGKTVSKEDETGLDLLRGKEVNYNELLMSYVVPYQVNQTINEGTTLTHPVYIQLGTLLMILNHMCTIYDSPGDKTDLKTQTPLVYIDFNPETNFCLSSNTQLSTNPFYFLIPFEGSFKDYKSLFDAALLEGNNITHLSDTKEKTPLFNPETQDQLSGQIPRFKYDEKTVGGSTAYRGKIMKVLVNIDYLLQIVKQYSQKNESNNIYLKPFLEQIISDMNKYLGGFNVLRLAYNDPANTFHIVDDQLTPGDPNERFISSDNKDQLPLYGLKSIAKKLEIKTEISTKLSNMIAISANSNPSDKATLSTNGTDFGFINTGYKDRYISNRKEIGSNNSNTDKNETFKNDTIINAALRFNQTIKDFYSTVNPSNSSVDQATNYYIEKMSKIKANDQATRASAMIPVSVNFTTDGIAGMNIGQGFTIPDQFLPYTYNTRTFTGIGVNNIQKVGFVVLGLNHTFENNQWDTSVRANMIFLKKLSDFDSNKTNTNLNKSNTFSTDLNNTQPTNTTTYNQSKNQVINPQFIGVRTQRDTTQAGPLEQGVVDIANKIFADIKSKYNNVLVDITSGNDNFHKGVNYNSLHKTGDAIDFTIYPATDANKTLINNLLISYQATTPGFVYFDEYAKLSKNATGGHFHIQFKS